MRRARRRAAAGLVAGLLMTGLLAAGMAQATEAVPAGHAQGAAWDFTLPLLDGSRFVRASAHAGPVLVNFWGRDCAPCISELPRLQKFARDHPHWTVLLVSTDAPERALEFVRRHGVALPVLRPGANVTALMREAGNRRGALPFTVALGSGGSAARICRSELGELDQRELARLVSDCR
jgi:outer membrane receptor for ferrienterochelin and colicins